VVKSPLALGANPRDPTSKIISIHIKYLQVKGIFWN
jgi:hypothetical protein